MSGLEHYAEAERLLLMDPDDREHSRALTARAQAHATLAVVWAHNRTQTELSNLLHTMLDQIREFREGRS